jgi:hypothetical protein
MKSVAFFLFVLLCMSCNVSVMRIEPSSSSAPRTSPAVSRTRFSVALPPGWRLEERTETVDSSTSVYRNARIGASITVTVSSPGSSPGREVSEAATSLSLKGWIVSESHTDDARVYATAVSKERNGFVGAAQRRPCGSRSKCTVTFVALWPQNEDSAGRDAVRSAVSSFRVHD